MKKILILIVFFIVLTKLFADENIKKEEIHKRIEFNIGGGLINYCLLGRNLYSIYQVANGITVPVSFIYYPNNFFGIGVTEQSGLLMQGVYYLPFFPYNFIFLNQLKVVNKFGSFKYNNWFLLEYGINFNGYFSIFTDETFFSVGPNVFIGFEKYIRRKFVMDIGFVFDTSYHERQVKYLGVEAYKEKVFIVYLGIETRFKFAIIKRVDKNALNNKN